MPGTLQRRALAGLLCAGFLLWGRAASANTVLVQDALTTAAKCTGACYKRTHVGSGGNFKSNGWHQSGGSHYVRYDLGQEVDCGMLEFDVSNFDPLNQIAAHGYIDEYHVLMRLNQDPAGVRIDAKKLDSALSLMALKRCKLNTGKDRKIRFCAWAAAGHGANKYTGEFNKGFDPTHTYHFVLEWDALKASVKVTDTTAKKTNSVAVSFTYPGCKKDPSLNLRYLYLGRDECKGCGQVMTGPVWSNLKVIAHSSCTKLPITYQCTAGAVMSQPCGKCGTQTRTCSAGCTWGSWGKCKECPGPDSGAVKPDSVAGPMDAAVLPADRGKVSGDRVAASEDQQTSGKDVGMEGSAPLTGGCGCGLASIRQPVGGGGMNLLWFLAVLIFYERRWSRSHRPSARSRGLSPARAVRARGVSREGRTGRSRSAAHRASR